MKKGIIGVMAVCAALAMGQALAQAPAAQPAQPESQVRAGEVARAVFTSDISEREPVDTLTALQPDTPRVYFFTELRNLDGQTVIHRWEQGGQVVAEIPFNVRGSRWRVWSSKNVDSGTTGGWTVSVVDGAGNELARERIAPAAQ